MRTDVLSSAVSRYFDLVKYLADDFLGCDIAGLSLISETDAVSEHIVGHCTNVFWDDISASLDESESPCSQRQVDRRTW